MKVGVIGATGYTGEELVRILVRHPHIELTYASGNQERQAKLQEIFPYLKNAIDLECRAFSSEEAASKSDFVFLSLPHTVSMATAPSFLKAGKKVVDVSADYRLIDTAVYEKFYKVKHTDHEHLKEAVYGLPEINREKIRKASLVANPGCYPTGAILGVLPGVKEKVFMPQTIGIDAKSGVTGAGRKADKALNFSEVNESFKAYKLFEHQHVPEMDQELSRAAGEKISVVFVPHLLPINRGILSTIYVGLQKKMDTAELVALYQNFYKKEPFVNVYADGTLPEVKHAAHTNFCHIGLRVNAERGMAVIVTAIDNLVKGAAGQAVQNMNIMCGFDERAGLV
ncbi:MAG: N-acetyl-gamma-glutamyl-phosphate reductase [Candidatus Omnitrophica bacterium]|nr:N-acetyl-gamma-glutamyl-phosphate reductase [Candidatus Omnitrophota bacterium]